MTPARVELKLILDYAGISDINLETFSQRFNIQKKVFLIQVMGCDLGYRFSWYIRGPYCRELTAEAFALKDELSAGDQEHEAFELAQQTKQRIEKATALWALPSGLAVSQDDWLELLASVHYLKHIVYWPKNDPRDFREVFNALIDAKPKFETAKEAAQRAWNRLDEFGLIRSKTLA
jgi:uncharacterized protein YwgA